MFIVYSLMYIGPTYVLLFEIEKLKYKFSLRRLLFLLTLQYLNTGLYLLNTRAMPNSLNSVILVFAFFIGLIYMIYINIIEDTILSILISFIFIFVLLLFILLFCITIITRGTFLCIFSFSIFLVCMLFLESGLKKITKPFNRFIYSIYNLSMGLIGFIVLVIAYNNPTELTLSSINKAFSDYSNNYSQSIFLFIIFAIFNFIVFSPLKSSASDILKRFLSSNK